MARQEVELRLVLAATWLLVLAHGWEQITESQLINFHKTGQWRDPFSLTSDHFRMSEEELEDTARTSKKPHEDIDKEAENNQIEYDNYEDEHPDEVEGFATSEMAKEVDEDDSDTIIFPDDKESAFNVEFVKITLKTFFGCTSPALKEVDVVCSEYGFEISFPPVPLSSVKVLGFKNISVEKAPPFCGYNLDHLKNILSVDFTGCNVKEDLEDVYSMQLSVGSKNWSHDFTAFCVESAKFNSDVFPRILREECAKKITPTPEPAKPTRCPQKKPKPSLTTTKPKPATTKLIDRTSTIAILAMSKPINCAVHVKERISCGFLGITHSACKRRGCCMEKFSCFYPLDECTADQHFVFAIRHDCAAIPFDPRKLFAPGKRSCKPAIANEKVAIFKIKFGECGARSYDVGQTTVYLVEVHNTINALNLKYGIITRTDPLRFLIECRHRKHVSVVVEPSIAQVGLRTFASNLPSSITSSGLNTVQLRIAKDRTYSSYYPTDHQPLRLLLGHPVYLELNLKSPKPDAVILVNYCVAYPRSAKNALVLIHEGCANPNDPTVSILKVNNLSNNRHQRRFKVDAFQFMDQKTNMYLNDEIYFMCSAEVCMPSEKSCKEQCFDGKGP